MAWPWEFASRAAACRTMFSAEMGASTKPSNPLYRYLDKRKALPTLPNSLLNPATL